LCSEPAALPADGATSDLQDDDAESDHSDCPAPLDCDDLAETFRSDTVAAVHLLLTLTPLQLTFQALIYAAYLNQRHAAICAWPTSSQAGVPHRARPTHRVGRRSTLKLTWDYDHDTYDPDHLSLSVGADRRTGIKVAPIWRRTALV